MYEMILLKCRCGVYCFSARSDSDLAEFLRRAIRDGWSDIDQEPVKAIESDGVTEIELAGTCGQCDRKSFVDSWLRRAANVREKFHKAG
jgi:hypothetical protein